MILCLISLRIPEWTNSYSKFWGNKSQQSTNMPCARQDTGRLFTSLVCTSVCIMSFSCPLLSTIILILFYRKHSKAIHSSFWTQRANSLIGNYCFSSPCDGKNHFPFLQAVKSHCPPGNEEYFHKLRFSMCYKIKQFCFISELLQG